MISFGVAKKTGQYAQRTQGTRKAVLYYLEPHEIQAIKELAHRRGASLRDAVVYAVMTTLERVRLDDNWLCAGCGVPNDYEATACSACHKRVQKL